MVLVKVALHVRGIVVNEIYFLGIFFQSILHPRTEPK